MSAYEAIIYEAREGVATVALNRPEVHHAMNEALRRDLLRCFEGLADDDGVRAIVVTGAGGKAFSAGADIREFTAPQVPTAFREHRRRLDFRQAMERCWQPIIAAIGGYCFGGGLELALGCHYRVARGDAKISFPEVKLGLIPGAQGTQRLPRLVGLEAAVNLIVSALRCRPRLLPARPCSTRSRRIRWRMRPRNSPANWRSRATRCAA